METLEIQSVKGTYFVPYVKLDAATGECIIMGESYLEDTWDFYRPIQEWIKQYCDEIQKPIHFTFKLHYYNTSSSKCFLDIVKQLKDYQDKGGAVTIDWYYPEDDDNIREEAEDYQEFLGISVNIMKN